MGNFRQHKQKVEGKQKGQKEVETTIMRDIQTLQRNLKEKVSDLIARGIDLDELFYEMREDEEIKFEKDMKIEVEKSAIAKHIGFRFIIGLKVPERKKNTEIQTYNVDFLIDQEKTKQAFDDARREKIFESNAYGNGLDVGVGDDDVLDVGPDDALIRERDQEARYREFKE